MNISKMLQRIGASFTAALLLCILVLPCTAAKKQTVLRVAFPEADGFTMTGEDGSRYGLTVDFLNEIAKYTGWQYEYVDTDSDTLLDDFFAGNIDLMGGTYYSEGFEEYFAYPDYNCGYSKIVLLARKDGGIKSYDLNTFQGKTIGVFEPAEENIRRLQEYLSINDLDCTLRYYSKEDLAVTGDLKRFLESGEVDLLLGNSADIGEDFYIAAAFDSQPHYIVTTPGNQEVLDGLNMALERIYDADPNFAKKLYEANFPAIGGEYTELNQRELQYIEEKGTVKVAVPEDWHPMMCINSEDSHDGFVPDVLDAVTNFSGLAFEYIYCDSYADSLEKIQQGEADLLGFFIGTEEEAASQGLALTSSFVELDSILVRNKESTYPAEGLIGAVQEGRRMPQGITADEVRYYSAAVDALNDVNRGKVDFFYGMASNLERIIQQENLTNVVQVVLINDTLDISMGMTSPAQPELLTILNKAINNLSDAEKSAINSRNLISIGDSHMTLSNIVYANPGLSIAVVGIILVCILGTVVLIARSRIRNAVMRGELEKAAADSRAKSAFLSRMSHEIRTPMNAIIGLTDLTAMAEDLPAQTRENLEKIKSSSHYLLNLISDILDMSRIESGKMELASEVFSLPEMLDEIRDMMTAEAQNKGVTFRVEQSFQEENVIGDSMRLRQVLINLLSNAFKFTPSGGQVVLSAVGAQEKEGSSAYLFKVTDTGVGIAPEDQARIFQSFEQIGPNVAKSQGTGLGLAISRHIVELMGSRLELKSQIGSGSEFSFSVTLPKAPERAGEAAAPTERQQDFLHGVTILVVEDNDLNAEIAGELLRLQGAAVERAVNGRVAVELFQNSPENAYDLILMDIMMPEMDGLEAARAIRALPREDAGQIPIIAMTANAFQEDVAAAQAAGMTGFLSKPLDLTQLFFELQKAVRQNGKTNHNPGE